MPFSGHGLCCCFSKNERPLAQEEVPMKVVEIASAKGLPDAAVIDELPEGLAAGALVACGSRRWTIARIETVRALTKDHPAALVLTERPLPLVGDELTLLTE